MASLDQIVTESCLDFIGQTLVFRDGESRLTYHDRFKELYDREPTWQNFSYGKIHNLSEISEFLVLLTEGALAEGLEEPSERQRTMLMSPKSKAKPKSKPLHEWKSVDWRAFRSRLIKIQVNMMRCHASASVDDIYRGDSENPGIDESRQNDPWFVEKLTKVLDLLSLHEELAPFRDVLEDRSLVSGDEALLPLSLPDQFVQDFMTTIDNLDGGSDQTTDRLVESFGTFLKNDGTDAFHSASTIRKLLDDPSQMYSYARLLDRVEKLIRNWVSTVFGPPTIVGRTPPIRRAANAIPPDRGVVAERQDVQLRALQRLQRSRERLMDSLEDPLAAAVTMATRATRTRKRKHRNPVSVPAKARDDDDEYEYDLNLIRDWEEEVWEEEVSGGESSDDKRPAISGKANKERRRRMYQAARGRLLERKKTAKRIDFTQSDNEDNDEVLPEVKRRIKVSESPSQAKYFKKSQEKCYEGRRNWTDLEKAAVVDGIKVLGVGNWAAIKRREALILRDRTSGQIKDCFRTMKNRGELDSIREAWPDGKKKSTVREEKKKEEKGKDEEKGNGNTDEEKEEDGTREKEG